MEIKTSGFQKSTNEFPNANNNFTVPNVAVNFNS